MAKFWLCNNVRASGRLHFAGEEIDDGLDPAGYAALVASGARLYAYANATVAAAAVLAQSMRLRAADPSEIESVMMGAADAANATDDTTLAGRVSALEQRVAAPAANEAAIKALAPAARFDGQLVVDLTNDVPWEFDSGSVAGASAWVLVPDSGTGRWLRKNASLADLAAVTGAGLIGSDAAGYVGSTVAAQLAEVKAEADAGMPVQKCTVTVAFGDLAAGVVNGASVAVNIGAGLPANARIVGASVDLATPFTGGGAASVSLSIGSIGDPAAIVNGADVLAAAVDGQASTLPAGKAPHKHFAIGAVQLLATFTPDGAAALAGLTAGACTVDVLYTVLA